jgi:type I restriction enzyme S subunit
MVSFPKYENYKDSGVEWLGEIPQDWRIVRAKYVLQEILPSRSKSIEKDIITKKGRKK